jgi:nuclear cap-binding protein subunit 1
MKVYVFCYGLLKHLFQITADPKTPPGYAVRADLLDIIEIFEVNRKECARLLVEYPKWTVKGTFKPRPGDPTEASDRIPLPGRDWQLESTLIEVLSPFSCAYASYHL